MNPLLIKAGKEVGEAIGELAWRYLLKPTIHKFAKNRKEEIQSWIKEESNEEIDIDNSGNA